MSGRVTVTMQAMVAGLLEPTMESTYPHLNGEGEVWSHIDPALSFMRELYAAHEYACENGIGNLSDPSGKYPHCTRAEGAACHVGRALTQTIAILEAA